MNHVIVRRLTHPEASVPARDGVIVWPSSRSLMILLSQLQNHLDVFHSDNAIHEQCYDSSMEQITISLVNRRVSIVLVEEWMAEMIENIIMVSWKKYHHSTQVHHPPTASRPYEQHFDSSRDQIKPLEK
jgi:hypothetical protein